MRRAWRELRTHPDRTVSVGLAVVVSVAFVVACLVFVATETRGVGQRLSAPSSTSDVLVDLGGDPAPVAAAAAALPGVAAVSTSARTYAAFSTAAGPGPIELQTLPDRPEFRWSELGTGRWPTTADQVVLSPGTARSYAVGPGDVLTLEPLGDRPARRLVVTGLLDEGRALFADLGDSGVVAPAFAAATAPGDRSGTVLVRVQPGTEPGAVAAALQPVVGEAGTVQTSAEAGAAALHEATGVADLFGYLVLVFGSIAVLVGSMTVLNTLVIILTQRRREIGLLRAVGASTRQVRRMLLAEALLTGLLGSAAGVVLGTGVAALVATVTGGIGAGLAVPPLAVGLGFVGGVVVTVLASLVPVGRASRVAPLEALRPVAPEADRHRHGRLRVVAGGLGTLLGVAVIVVALTADAHNVVLAVAGAAITAVGVLALAVVVVPALLRGVGLLARRGGPTARLAAANLVRNPGRSAATCTALMLAVGLIVTLQVGSATVGATLDDALDAKFPVDLVVVNPDGPLSTTVTTAVAGVPGVTATVPVRSVRAGLPGAGDDGVAELTVSAPGAGVERVVPTGLDQLTGRNALVDDFTLEMLGARSGDPLELSYQGRRGTFVLRSSEIPRSGGVAVTDAALAALAPTAPTSELWAAAADRDEARAVVAAVRQATVSQPGLRVDGSLTEAAEVVRVLDRLLAVATGLLAVAVLIALIGVGTTLGLSVLERTRESALLRALGLQRRQLRGMLTVEAVLLALVGAAVGVVVGIAFGGVGAVALAEETDMGRLHLAVPVLQTLGVVAVVALAGALASVLPARRAAMATPTEALADR
ncbi:putative ABC transport system permease protein [Friedmanniella luteola]|uniref:Putative ABC transport system permease protein n=1 Tax=Friedmanniella luteola TaxID=546871 RepID=A0A1H2A8V8_9ACTN|nr:ABC transporter permease [Friedmanniella luteola]SDT42410.1 putative ABC transport system permease protein [Friedmanniella luteola]